MNQRPKTEILREAIVSQSRQISENLRKRIHLECLQEIALNSVESQRPSEFIDYATFAALARGLDSLAALVEAAVARAGRSTGMCFTPITLRNCRSATRRPEPTQRSTWSPGRQRFTLRQTVSTTEKRTRSRWCWPGCDGVARGRQAGDRECFLQALLQATRRAGVDVHELLVID